MTSTHPVSERCFVSEIAGLLTRRSFTAAAAAAAAAAGLTACSRATNGGDPQDDGDGAAVTSATVALPVQVDTLDPVAANVALQLYRVVYDQLTAIDAEGAIQPRLATDWTSDETGAVWTFTLRDDATFSDGTPVTAADVVASYQSILADATSANKVLLAAVSGVSSPAEGQVVFTLAAPVVSWPRQASNFSVVPAASYDAATFTTTPITSGPYSVKSFDRTAGTVELVAADGYWGEAPALTSITVLSIPDETTRSTSLQTGEIDYALVSAAQISTLEGSGKVTVDSVAGNKSVYLGFNTTAAGLGDPAVRDAIVSAIDREAIVANLLAGAGQPLGQVVAPAVVGHDETLPAPEFDADAARAAVAASGYDGTPITLQYPSSGSVSMGSEIAQAVSGYLTDIGLTVALEPLESGTFVTAWTTKTYTGMYMFILQPSSLDGASPANLLYGAKGYEIFDDPETRALAASQATILDEDARLEVFSQLWRRSSEQAFYAPLHAENYVYAWSSRVKGTSRVDGLVIVTDLTPA
jgi:peptide/nickel transport system substrate-binding protein